MGFTDIYSFTKAMAERAVVELAGDLPLSIVRPSIIESALAEPFPGWLEGFRMAEPIILAYGRGVLQDFPGLPDGLLDIIPLDYVVNSVLAIAATRPIGVETRGSTQPATIGWVAMPVDQPAFAQDHHHVGHRLGSHE